MGRYHLIQHRSDEFECPMCGNLCVVGDHVFESANDEYCSRECAERSHLDEIEFLSVRAL